ncbi:MAG: hypothetical protein EYC70_01820 [Planctomycetota bacterium]|nr:MAG: hypothetical protein EYC70_01820 [Planctomycetota bacterium]
MRPTLRAALALSLIAALGCAVDRGGTPGLDSLDWLAPGASTEAEVREKLGPPAFMRESATGTRYLTYHAFAISLYGLRNNSDVVVIRIENDRVQNILEGSYF